MCVAMANQQPYVVNSAFPGTCRPHANFLPDWSLINLFSAKIISGVWLWQNHTNYHAHMCLIILTQPLREHMSNFSIFGPNVWLRCLDIYIQKHTYMLTNQNVYKNGFDDLTPKVQSLYKSSFFSHFFSSHTNGK